MTVAMELYGIRPRFIICCGGKGENEPEAEGIVMRNWLIEHGADPEHVIAESRSVNTRENLLEARTIMEELGYRDAIVVTSDYHVARALALCRQIGIEATGKGSPSKPEYFIKNHLREGLSWIKFGIESMKQSTTPHLSQKAGSGGLKQSPVD